MAALEGSVSKLPHSSMAKLSVNKHRPYSLCSSCFNHRYLCAGGSVCAFVLAMLVWSLSGSRLGRNVESDGNQVVFPPLNFSLPAVNLRYDPPGKTFYDDPELGYSLEKSMKDWDSKRREWLKLHPSFFPGAAERIVVVTGSQPKPCKSPTGDHFLLRLFKNKVDYCRIHGYDIFYENVLFHRKMKTYWAKYGAVKATMLAHPEAEWIWWVDSDAVITDMDFKIPLERYRGFNLVVHGWRSAVVKDRSWTGLNAGVFLIRNCQWSLDFMNKWANMGPMSKEYRKWGSIEKSIFKDKVFSESDDQSSLVYLLYKNQRLLDTKVYLEGEYYLEGYWIGMLPKFGNATLRYEEMERGDAKLRRRRAEKVSEHYGALREPYLKKAGVVGGNWRRPFITHFTGCQPCSGDHNPSYTEKDCSEGMVKALNFADNQVLRNYGFMRPDLDDSETVVEVPFDYPEEGPFGKR